MPLPQSTTAVSFARVERRLWVARREVRCQPGQSCPERERLDSAARCRRRRAGRGEAPARTLSIEPGDVAEHDELPGDVLARPLRPLDRRRRPCAATRGRSRRSRGGRRAVGTGAPSRRRRGRCLAIAADQPPHAPELVPCQLGEVLLAKELVARGAELVWGRRRIGASSSPAPASSVSRTTRSAIDQSVSGARAAATGPRRNQAMKARSKSSSSSCRDTSVCRSVK